MNKTKMIQMFVDMVHNMIRDREDASEDLDFSRDDFVGECRRGIKLNTELLLLHTIDVRVTMLIAGSKAGAE